MRSICLAAFLMVALAALLPAIDISISALPASGIVGGPPGSVVGWGFTLTDSDPSDWVVPVGSSFTGSQVFGTYVDYLSLPTAPLYVAGPSPESATVAQAWDPILQLGLGEFDINSTAIPKPITGDIVVQYDVFSQDPNDLNFDPGSFVTDGTISVAVSVQVAPEPGTLWMLLAGGLPLALWRSARSLKAHLRG